MKQNEILLDSYLNNNTELSVGSIASYERMVKKYDQVDLTKAKFSQIMEVVNKDDNPNSKASTLNIAILLTKNRIELHTRLQKEREIIKNEIDARRKTLLKSCNESLPSYDDVIEKMNEMRELNYLVNYILINYALRNSDFMLEVITIKSQIPTDKQNYIYYNRKEKNITLLISSYKTFKSYGQKTITITDEKFIKIFKELNLKDGDYLISTKKGGKPSLSYLSDMIRSMTAFGLREGAFFKVVLKNLLHQHKYKELEAISLTRGTSLAVILTSYNLLNSESN